MSNAERVFHLISLNFVKNTPLRVVISTHFSVFGNVMKHSLSCLTYYFLFDKHRITNPL